MFQVCSRSQTSSRYYRNITSLPWWVPHVAACSWQRNTYKHDSIPVLHIYHHLIFCSYCISSSRQQGSLLPRSQTSVCDLGSSEPCVGKCCIFALQSNIVVGFFSNIIMIIGTQLNTLCKLKCKSVMQFRISRLLVWITNRNKFTLKWAFLSMLSIMIGDNRIYA